jgi:hypothetical protein
MKRWIRKKFKFPKESWNKWKEALLSGEYAQGEGYLVSYKPDYEKDKYEEYENSIEFSTQTCNFCCLGVMAVCQDVPLSNLFAVEYLYANKKWSSIRASFWVNWNFIS